MKAFLKSIDYFSPRFTHTYKGKDKYKTVLGGTTTIIALLIILVNGWFIGKDIYLRENPTVIGYEQAFPYYPTTKINYDNIFFGFFISDTFNDLFEDESILKIIPLMYTNYYDNNGNLKYKERFLELTDCHSEFDRLNLTLPLAKIIMKPIKCIKNFNEILSGFWTDTHLSYLKFKVIRCTNETITEDTNLKTKNDLLQFQKFEKNMNKINLISLNNVNEENEEFISKLNNMIKTSKSTSQSETKNITCSSIEEIEKVTSNLFFNFFYTSLAIDSKNYRAPMIKQISKDRFTLGMGILKTIDYYFQNFIVRTDDGLIFSESYKDIDKIGYYKYLVDHQLIDSSDANIFWLNIYISNQVKYMTREYIKIQSIFANLGGIIQVVLIFFKVFFYPYFKKKLNLKIINELFDFDDNQISGITNKKVVEKRNIKTIDSLIRFKYKYSKDKIFTENQSDIIKIKNTNNKSTFFISNNKKITNNPFSSINSIKINRLSINSKKNERRIPEITDRIDTDFENKYKNKNFQSIYHDLGDLNENSTDMHLKNKKDKALHMINNPLKLKDSIINENENNIINCKIEKNLKNECEMLSKENLEIDNHNKLKSFQEDILFIKDNVSEDELTNRVNEQITYIKKTSNKHRKNLGKKSSKCVIENKQLIKSEISICSNDERKIYTKQNSYKRSKIIDIGDNSNNKFEKNAIYSNSFERKRNKIQEENSKNKKINLKENFSLKLKDNINILKNIQCSDDNNSNTTKHYQLEREGNRKSYKSHKNKIKIFQNNQISDDCKNLKKNAINDLDESLSNLNVNNFNSNVNSNKKINLNISINHQNQNSKNDLINNLIITKPNNNLFYIKRDNNSNNNKWKKRYNLSQHIESNEFEKKIYDALNVKGRKLNLRNIEIFNSFYCYFCCRSRIYKQKNMLYKYALENLNHFTDYLESLKNFQDLTKIKYLLFSTEQILSFPYLSNPRRMKGGIHHEIQEYARAFETRACKKETAVDIFNYFHKNILNNKLNGIDKKIWNIFDPKMKNLFISNSNNIASSGSYKKKNIKYADGMN